jgi:hypothetical protein
MVGEPGSQGGSVKRWTAFAALGLAAAAGIVTPGTAQASSHAWYQVYQSGFSGYFDQTVAISKNNVWSVGDTFTRTGKVISSIAATVVYRWNGARWAKIPMPAMTYLQGVTVLAPNNVWAFGSSGTVSADIFHWNGSKWQYYLDDSINFVPQGISASGRDNVWVSGFAYSGSRQVLAAYRWNGTAWHPVSMPHPVLDDGGPNVTAVSSSNVWIGWSDTSTSQALHWDGHHWHTVTAPYYADPFNIVPDGKGGYWFGAQAILTGSTWTAEQVPAFSGASGGVTRIPGTTSFLVDAGVEASSSTTEKPTIFRFDL